MKTLAFFVVMASSTLAVAEPRFEVIDRGTAIEVIAHELKASRTAVNPARTRLEVDLVGTPKIAALVPSNFPIKVVELDGYSPRRLSVKLPLERAQVKTMSRFAQAIQVGDDLHLLFPKQVPADDARVVLPEPTLPKEIAAKLGPKPFGPDPAAPKLVEHTSEAPVAGATQKVEPEAKPEVKPEAPAKSDDNKSFLAPEEPSSNFSFYAMAGLGAIALGAWFMKKKKKAGIAQSTTIDVIAQRSLGSKAKVVWLNAGGREMVVAVTPQQVRMLGQWKKSDSSSTSTGTPAAMPFAQALENSRNEKPARAQTSSPVAGILKLRERASTIEGINEEVATGDLDADAIWAKEIFAAAGGRR